MTFVDGFAIARDLILSLVAITGAVVAIIGLNTWQRQLTGQVEYDLSRRLLVSLFKYRDAIDGVRFRVSAKSYAKEFVFDPNGKLRDYGKRVLAN